MLKNGLLIVVHIVQYKGKTTHFNDFSVLSLFFIGSSLDLNFTLSNTNASIVKYKTNEKFENQWNTMKK